MGYLPDEPDWAYDAPTVEELIERHMLGVPDCYRVQTLARMGIVGRAKLFQLIRDGVLPAKKLGSSTIILRSAWLEFLQSLPDVNRHREEAQRRELARVRRARVAQRAAGAASAPRIGASKRERGRR